MKFSYALLTGLLLAAPALASPMTFTAALNGASEPPPTPSTATGLATVSYDSVTHMLLVNVGFSGLMSTTTASHIHCCTAAPMTGSAGVATELPTFSGFPLGVTSGTFLQSFDLTQASSFNPAFVTAQGSVTAVEAALVAGLMDGTAYLNIHTLLYPGGEIAGYFAPAATATPEPASLALLGAGVFGLWRLRRRKERSGGTA